MEQRLEQLIDSLEDKLGKLIKDFSALKEVNQQLQHQLSLQESQTDHLNKQLREANHKNGLLKNANALLGSDEHKKETKLKINALVKEIDQCIAQLS